MDRSRVVGIVAVGAVLIAAALLLPYNAVAGTRAGDLVTYISSETGGMNGITRISVCTSDFEFLGDGVISFTVNRGILVERRGAGRPQVDARPFVGVEGRTSIVSTDWFGVSQNDPRCL